MSTIDWNKAAEDAKDLENGVYPHAPKGRYTVEIAKATAKPSAGGKEMIQARVVIAEGPHSGVSFLEHFVITENNSQAQAYLAQKLQAFGVFDILVNGGSFEQVAGALVTKRAEADLVVEKYKGADGNKAKTYYPVGTPAPVASTGITNF